MSTILSHKLESAYPQTQSLEFGPYTTWIQNQSTEKLLVFNVETHSYFHCAKQDTMPHRVLKAHPSPENFLSLLAFALNLHLTSHCLSTWKLSSVSVWCQCILLFVHWLAVELINEMLLCLVLCTEVATQLTVMLSEQFNGDFTGKTFLCFLFHITQAHSQMSPHCSTLQTASSPWMMRQRKHLSRLNPTQLLACLPSH